MFEKFEQLYQSFTIIYYPGVIYQPSDIYHRFQIGKLWNIHLGRHLWLVGRDGVLRVCASNDVLYLPDQVYMHIHVQSPSYFSNDDDSVCDYFKSFSIHRNRNDTQATSHPARCITSVSNGASLMGYCTSASICYSRITREDLNFGRTAKSSTPWKYLPKNCVSAFPFDWAQNSACVALKWWYFRLERVQECGRWAAGKLVKSHSFLLRNYTLVFET